jgi:hypothetical protein
MRDSLEQTLVHEALDMALGQRLSAKVEGQLLFHSDRAANTPRSTLHQLRGWEAICL